MKCEILLIQETWLYNFQHEEIGKVLVDSEHHAVSAMDECDVSRVGRPYGGCGDAAWRWTFGPSPPHPGACARS